MKAFPDGGSGAVELIAADTWRGVTFRQPHRVLSSAPVGGGDVLARRIINLCVDGPDARSCCEDPQGTFRRLGERHGWRGTTVGLMTGVPMSRLGRVRGPDDNAGWLVLATVGVSNAHRAGEPSVTTDGPGTINVIAVTPACLTAGARAEAAMLVTEAKCACLADHGIPSANGHGVATGTGTDAVAVASRDGMDTPYTGYHTISGQLLVSAVRQALDQSLSLAHLGHCSRT
jgi:adenosylcobinamide amidohydrolase